MMLSLGVVVVVVVVVVFCWLCVGSLWLSLGVVGFVLQRSCDRFTCCTCEKQHMTMAVVLFSCQVLNHAIAFDCRPYS